MVKAWANPDKDLDSTLVQQFEKQNSQRFFAKQYPSRFPHGQPFVVRWKNYSYFVVPYGGSNANQFCVIGLDRKKKTLKCRTTSGPNQPHHLNHVADV